MTINIQIYNFGHTQAQAHKQNTLTHTKGERERAIYPLTSNDFQVQYWRARISSRPQATYFMRNINRQMKSLQILIESKKRKKEVKEKKFTSSDATKRERYFKEI